MHVVVGVVVMVLFAALLQLFLPLPCCCVDVAFPDALTHSVTHSPTHSLTYSPTYSLTHPHPHSRRSLKYMPTTTIPPVYVHPSSLPCCPSPMRNHSVCIFSHRTQAMGVFSMVCNARPCVERTASANHIANGITCLKGSHWNPPQGLTSAAGLASRARA